MDEHSRRRPAGPTCASGQEAPGDALDTTRQARCGCHRRAARVFSGASLLIQFNDFPLFERRMLAALAWPPASLYPDYPARHDRGLCASGYGFSDFCSRTRTARPNLRHARHHALDRQLRVGARRTCAVCRVSRGRLPGREACQADMGGTPSSHEPAVHQHPHSRTRPTRLALLAARQLRRRVDFHPRVVRRVRAVRDARFEVKAPSPRTVGSKRLPRPARSHA